MHQRSPGDYLLKNNSSLTFSPGDLTSSEVTKPPANHQQNAKSPEHLADFIQYGTPAESIHPYRYKQPGLYLLPPAFGYQNQCTRESFSRVLFHKSSPPFSYQAWNGHRTQTRIVPYSPLSIHQDSLSPKWTSVTSVKNNLPTPAYLLDRHANWRLSDLHWCKWHARFHYSDRNTDNQSKGVQESESTIGKSYSII